MKNAAIEQDEGSTETLDEANPEGEAEESEPETTETEIDGVKYTIPAALKDSFLMQGDYTRKTQELAAERKALDEAKVRVQQAGEAGSQRAGASSRDPGRIAAVSGCQLGCAEAQDPMAAIATSGSSQLQNAYGEGGERIPVGC